jgi:hypothetical protein
MTVSNPFSITYGTTTVGGGSGTYQLLGPYVIDKSYDAIRLVFDVIVVAGSFSGLQSAAASIENTFRERLTDGDELKISLSGNAWTYKVGESILKVRASITKSSNPETDRGYSRAYTVSIEGEMPADDSNDAGLRDVEVLVDLEASRRKIVTMRGTYTATTAGDAKANYDSKGDGVATDYLDVVDSSATFELVDETFTLDREGSAGSPAPHVLNFTRQYAEIIAAQTAGALDDPQIRDHRITFTDLGQYPGDSLSGSTASGGTSAGGGSADRLKRVVASYDCAVDVDETTDLTSVYKAKIKDHVRALFVQNFEPAQFGVEEERVSYDTTANRISVSLQFIYQRAGGETLVEISQSVAYREARQIDYTPTHDEDEFAANADVGFATFERVWNRTAIAIGSVAPKMRIRERASPAGAIGRFSAIAGVDSPDNRDTSKVEREGWNVTASTSQVDNRYLGDPQGDERIEVSVLNETVVERFHTKPGARTSNPITGGGAPTTGGG